MIILIAYYFNNLIIVFYDILSMHFYFRIDIFSSIENIICGYLSNIMYNIL